MTEADKNVQRITRALHKAEQRVEDLRRQWVAARNEQLQEQRARQEIGGANV